MRTTHSLVQVCLAMMADPDARYWGYDLTRRTGVRSGVLYPILGRMLDEGWLSDGWEESDEIEGKRPPRRYYELTSLGKESMGALLRKAEHDKRFGLMWRPAW